MVEKIGNPILVKVERAAPLTSWEKGKTSPVLSQQGSRRKYEKEESAIKQP